MEWGGRHLPDSEEAGGSSPGPLHSVACRLRGRRRRGTTNRHEGKSSRQERRIRGEEPGEQDERAGGGGIWERDAREGNAGCGGRAKGGGKGDDDGREPGRREGGSFCSPCLEWCLLRDARGRRACSAPRRAGVGRNGE